MRDFTLCTLWWALKQQKCNKRQRETRLYVLTLDYSQQCGNTLPEQIKPSALLAMLNKQNLRYLEKERLLLSLQESSCVVATVFQFFF